VASYDDTKPHFTTKKNIYMDLSKIFEN
jgi:hypothetical protein